MTDSLEIRTTGPIVGSIRPPGSKSITNRALVCAALAGGESLLSGVLDSDDTQVMIEALRQLGIPVAHDASARTLRVQGCGGRPPATQADLFVGNSGTTMRFLTALVGLGHGQYRLHGVQRMHERPIEDLLAALQQMGVDARSQSGNSCPPVLVRGTGLPGGKVSIPGNVSSQFLSGLLMAVPCAATTTEIAVRGELVSQPYIYMTLNVMRSFGARCEADDLRRFVIPGGQTYRGQTYAIEPDASAASYFFAAAAITGGQVTVEGLTRDSLQGDVALVDCLEQMGCRVEVHADAITVAGGPLRGIDVDMNAISDTVQTLAAVAVFADGPTTVRGVAHMRHKETDRIAALVTELGKLGAEVEERSDGLRIVPRRLHAAAIDTYDDHRMAMSMALTGLRVPGVVIRDPGCTRKTYPEFFADLDRLCGR